MNNELEVPESFRTYLLDQSVRIAVDKLLNNGQKLPPNLEWQEIPDYHDALYSAYRIQHDYNTMILSLMDKTFLEVAKTKGIIKIWTLPEWVATEKPSPENIWNTGLCCYLHIPKQEENSVGFFLTIDENNKIYAGIWTDLKGFNLSDLTEWSFDDPYWIISDNYAPDLSVGKINLSVMQNQIEKAISRLDELITR